jgi:hypothetical protein
MNDWDRDNLHFILNSTDDSFEHWLDQADNDDIDYALKLIRIAKCELIEQEHDLLNEVDDVTEAKELIDKFRINHKNS